MPSVGCSTCSLATSTPRRGWTEEWGRKKGPSRLLLAERSHVVPFRVPRDPQTRPSGIGERPRSAVRRGLPLLYGKSTPVLTAPLVWAGAWRVVRCHHPPASGWPPPTVAPFAPSRPLVLRLGVSVYFWRALPRARHCQRLTTKSYWIERRAPRAFSKTHPQAAQNVKRRELASRSPPCGWHTMMHSVKAYFSSAKRMFWGPSPSNPLTNEPSFSDRCWPLR